MTVMTIKQINKFSEDSSNEPLPDTMDDLAKREAEILEVINSLGENAMLAKEILLKRMTEEELAKFLNSMSKITTFAAAASEEGGMGLMMATMTGELVGYTHSVILATIGALINEEIL